MVSSKTLYGYDSYLGQLQRQSSAGDRGPVAGVGDRVGKLDKSHEGHVVNAGVNYVCNVCGSTHSCSAWSGMHLCKTTMIGVEILSLGSHSFLVHIKHLSLLCSSDNCPSNPLNEFAGIIFILSFGCC